MKSVSGSIIVFILALAAGLSFTAQAQHNPGKSCISCHQNYGLGGTVFESYEAGNVVAGTRISLVRSDGGRVTLPESDDDGRVYSTTEVTGSFLIQIGNRRSRTWHALPGQKDCNSCHISGGNGSAQRSKELFEFHTEVPVDNDCGHCHHFPASMDIAQLRTPGSLNGALDKLPVQGSKVVIGGTRYDFDAKDYDIRTLRPDIFTPGFFSFFDVILAVAESHGHQIVYNWDESCQTHFIESVDGVQGDFWYHFSYDAGAGTEGELRYRRQLRWDELLYQPGSWTQLVMGEDVAELRREFQEEIVREQASGHRVSQVRITINPSNYQGNPEGSGRISVQKSFRDVQVTSHRLRESGTDSLHLMPFQPGVVTAMDVLYSLQDQGELTLVGRTYFTRLATKVMESFRIRKVGFPGVGEAHASGRHGFVYTTGNGTSSSPPNNADRKQHVHADINVIHAPDQATWRWIELGNPYYEKNEPTGVREMLADYEARDRGFRLQLPFPQPASDQVRLSFNIFEPGTYSLAVYDLSGRLVEKVFEGRLENIGVQRRDWATRNLPAGTYFVNMSDGISVDVQRVQIVR